MKGYIYKIENIITGKVYIGQTVNYKRRTWNHFQNYKDLKQTSPLYRSMRKHGKEVFKSSIVLIVIDDSPEVVQELLNDFEAQYISRLNTITPNGYNVRLGGLQGGLGVSYTAERKKEQSQITKDLWCKGIFDNRPPISDETKVKLSRCMKGRTITAEARVKIGNAHRGKKYTDETRMRISKSRKGLLMGSENPAARSIKNETTGEIFTTIKNAAKHYGISASNISSACAGNLKTSGGYVWSYL